MAFDLNRRTAVVGVGATPYYRRGESLPRTVIEMAGEATLLAVQDAGLSIEDVDGFAYYAGGLDTALLAQVLGIPEVKFTATLTGGGGGAAGCVGLASAAVVSGLAEVVVSVHSIQQAIVRFGAAFANKQTGSGSSYARPPTPEGDFLVSSGLFAPGQMFAMLTQRHMYQYGTRREAFAEVAMSERQNALSRPKAMFKEPLTLDAYMSAPMISEPLCLYDYTPENDGAVAVITTSAERARDLRHPPAYVLGSSLGAAGRWGKSITWMGMPEEYFASSGHRPVARNLFERAGLTPADVDVAMLYDHFTSMVLMQLEDYGFCGIGEGGPFVESGAIRFPAGQIPVNTHGGNLSEAYIAGITHVMEGVEQIRGTAVNQVPDAQVALVTGGPAPMPVSGLLLGR